MTSLTAPWDRKSDTKIERGRDPLTAEQTAAAVSELVDSTFLEKYPRTERAYADPVYNNQVYSLHSFVPSKGATPDEHGVFGFIKFRGAFQTVDEANDRAEHLIRYVDSYHSIQTGYIGKPFPVCVDTRKYVKEVNEVDLSKKTSDTISDDVKRKRLEEKKQIQEIKEREEQLLKTTGEDYEPEPLEKYTTLQVKKANLVYTYLKTQEKIKELQTHIRNAYREIADMDAQDASYRKDYFERYTNARKQAGLPQEELEDNFMKYMCEDAELDFEYKV